MALTQSIAKTLILFRSLKEEGFACLEVYTAINGAINAAHNSKMTAEKGCFAVTILKSRRHDLRCVLNTRERKS